MSLFEARDVFDLKRASKRIEADYMLADVHRGKFSRNNINYGNSYGVHNRANYPNNRLVGNSNGFYGNL